MPQLRDRHFYSGYGPESCIYIGLTWVWCYSIWDYSYLVSRIALPWEDWYSFTIKILYRTEYSSAYHIDMCVIWWKYWAHSMVHRPGQYEKYHSSRNARTGMVSRNGNISLFRPGWYQIWWYLHNSGVDSNFHCLEKEGQNCTKAVLCCLLPDNETVICFWVNMRQQQQNQ